MDPACALIAPVAVSIGAMAYLSSIRLGSDNTPRVLHVKRGVQAMAFSFFIGLGVSGACTGLLPSLSPVLAVSGSLASRTLLGKVWPALVVLASAPVLGRAFCGWICPLGAAIDAVDHLKKFFLGRRELHLDPRPKYWILFAVIAAAVAGSPLPAGLLDPLSATSRALSGGPGFAPALVAGGALLVGMLARRAWCRMLCPLGACLALLADAPIVRRRTGPCRSCSKCAESCPTESIVGDGRDTLHAECVLCMSCAGQCEGTHFWPSAEPSGGIGTGKTIISRRAFVASAALGLASAPLFAWAGNGARPVRPPGARPEADFLRRCLRCGACSAACPTGTLRVSGFEAGLEGLLSPSLNLRKAPCSPDCVSCGRVCPSGAIRQLSLEEKPLVAIGLAKIDRSRCIPWSDIKSERGCLMCEEHCPVGAIVLRRSEGKSSLLPYVLPERCNGCGVCENICPVEGPAAIRVEGFAEQLQLRPPESVQQGLAELLPDETDLPGWRLVEGPFEEAPAQTPGLVAASASYALGQAVVKLIVYVAQDVQTAEGWAAALREKATPDSAVAQAGVAVALASADGSTGATAQDAQNIASIAVAKLLEFGEILQLQK